jgi:hypothetical protein
MPYRKLSDADKLWIIRHDLKNVPHSSMARRFGISRERVRQICRDAGHPTRRSRLYKWREDTAARKRRGKQQRKQREQRLRRLSRLWRSGCSIQRFMYAGGFKNVNSANTGVCFLRQRYGDELFPKRMRLDKMWRAGAPRIDLAKAANWTENTLGTSISTARKFLPNLFPRRPPAAGSRSMKGQTMARQHDENKLPKWAQKRLIRLRQELNDAQYTEFTSTIAQEIELNKPVQITVTYPLGQRAFLRNGDVLRIPRYGIDAQIKQAIGLR